MRAARVHRFGSPDVISVEELAIPTPADDEVLIRVHAAGVGPWDAWVRAGKSALPQPLPLTLGSDLSGIVVGVGSAASGFEPGQEVFGVTNSRFTGAYADYAAAKASMVAPRPQTLSHHETAAAPVVAVTASQMVFDHANVKAHERVLVLGAAGSVGACAVQLARRTGAYVIGTALSEDIEYVTQLGVDQVIDAFTPLAQAVEPVDAVIDVVGGKAQAQALAVVRPGGVLISSVSRPPKPESARPGIRTGFILVDVTTKALLEIAPLLESGDVTVRIGSVLSLSQARLAHEMLAGTAPRAAGKIVLSTDS